MPSDSRCVMGCPPGQQLHIFPLSKSKRAEWCRILGVYPRTKRPYLCNAHIPECYLFGNRLSKFAMPIPPETRNIYSQRSALNNSSAFRFSDYKNETFLVNTEQPESAENTDNFAEDPLNVNSIEVELSAKDENKTEEPQEDERKVEDFEVRKKDNNNMIIKGRYFQTNDYLVVSYTTPKKWTLQEQAKILDNKCTQQLRNLKDLNRENYRLRMELRKYEALLPKLRFLQAHNRLLYAELKMYKIQEKNRRKRIKRKQLRAERQQENPVIELE